MCVTVRRRRSPGKAPVTGHAKPESPGQSTKGSRRGSRTPKGRTPTESEFSSAVIKYPGAQKKRGSHAQQTGPAWPGLRLPVIIAVCSCTILVSIVVLVLTLLLVTNPSKSASSTSLAPRA
ncbi:hypothetical protein V5799_011362 [Amblyomma americanum]|uniref:Uncharacterized protein n=1 Tax=Amblyomma americanum TaxID=6943 RepID=A0AAQ4EHA2_AMBAM